MKETEKKNKEEKGKETTKEKKKKEEEGEETKIE